MKKLILFLLLAPALLLGAADQIDSSSNNIPIAFSASDAGSTLVTCGFSKALLITNESSSRLAWGVGTSSTAPSKDAGFVAASVIIARDNYNVGSGDVLYIRSDTGLVISSGIVSGECW